MTRKQRRLTLDWSESCRPRNRRGIGAWRAPQFDRVF